jgi:hypothetical protein
MSVPKKQARRDDRAMYVPKKQARRDYVLCLFRKKQARPDDRAMSVPKKQARRDDHAYVCSKKNRLVATIVLCLFQKAGAMTADYAPATRPNEQPCAR